MSVDLMQYYKYINLSNYNATYYKYINLSRIFNNLMFQGHVCWLVYGCRLPVCGTHKVTFVSVV